MTAFGIVPLYLKPFFSTKYKFNEKYVGIVPLYLKPFFSSTRITPEDSQKAFAFFKNHGIPGITEDSNPIIMVTKAK